MPELYGNIENLTVADRDREMKQKSKDYCDLKRNAKENQIVPGDELLVKQDKQNKLSPSNHPEPFQVVDNFHSQMTVRSPQGWNIDEMPVT